VQPVEPPQHRPHSPPPLAHPRLCLNLCHPPQHPLLASRLEGPEGIGEAPPRASLQCIAHKRRFKRLLPLLVRSDAPLCLVELALGGSVDCQLREGVLGEQQGRRDGKLALVQHALEGGANEGDCRVVEHVYHTRQEQGEVSEEVAWDVGNLCRLVSVK